MKMKTCENGHIYDEDLYPNGCPYCDPSRKVISYDRTMSVTSTGGSGGAEGLNRTTMKPHPNGDRGKTVAPSRDPKPQEEQGTVAPDPHTSKTVVWGYGHHDGPIPVTGWLVCVDGPANLKGRSFEIKSKVNTIGRSSSNDIQLDDPTITGIEHARLGYDARNREFTLIPERSSNTTYVNDHAVYTATLLNEFDLIEFGDCKMLFVPFCGPRFGWDTGLEAKA